MIALPFPLFCSLAIDAQLWGLALLISRLLGEAVAARTAAAFAQQCLPPESALQTLCVQLGGSSLTSSPGGGAAPMVSGSWDQGSTSLLGSWRQQLAVLAANRTPGDDKAMERLGRRLAAAGHPLKAHVCFVLAGMGLQPLDDPHTAFALIGGGAGRATAPRLPAILRTEMYTWARGSGE
jgi:COPII coat assembly protein SEC16